MPALISPNETYKDSYADAMEEGLQFEPSSPAEIALARRDFAAYMHQRFDLNRPVILPDMTQIKRVPQYDFWLMEGDRFLAIASLRPELSKTLERRGGHIGYAVRASERRKGYGRMALDLALPHLRDFGLTRALITCNDENQGSIRIIEGAGGILQDKVVISGMNAPERRYWIEL